MKVLIADDDLTSRTMLQAVLKKWGCEPQVTEDGAQAWSVLAGPDAPKLALLDWSMPELDGLEVSRRVRKLPTTEPPYILIVTSKNDARDIVEGLDAGANDYVAKPFHQDELRARLSVGQRMLALQKDLAERMAALQVALDHIKTLQGILPICCYCKKIREGKNYWRRVEDYISSRTDAQFSHGICEECLEKYHPEPPP